MCYGVGEKPFAMHEHDESNAPSSPPCLMHEFADELLPPPVQPDWNTVRTFRKAKRAELIARRGALSLHDRQHYAESLTAHLLATLGLCACPVLGFYWPIRGELDLRGFARATSKPAARRRYRSWSRATPPSSSGNGSPGTAMQRGAWNIPVPAERHPLVPRLRC